MIYHNIRDSLRPEQDGKHFADGIFNYRKISNISRTKSQNLNVSCIDLQLSLRIILKPSVKWRMKM